VFRPARNLRSSKLLFERWIKSYEPRVIRGSSSRGRCCHRDDNKVIGLNRANGEFEMKRTLFCALALFCINSAFGQAHRNIIVEKNEFGGPVYAGAPLLDVTASLVKAGGGAESFSIGTLLDSMVGPMAAKAEIRKLTRQYGVTRVDRFIMVFNYSVVDALKIATAQGVSLPTPKLDGTDLAKALVNHGTDSDGTFWTGYLLDKLLTHKIHMTVMDDIDKKWNKAADKDYHRISNQAHFDLSQALKIPGVKRASMH